MHAVFCLAVMLVPVALYTVAGTTLFTLYIEYWFKLPVMHFCE